MTKRFNFIYLFFLFVVINSLPVRAVTAQGDSYLISGLVRDDETDEPIPFASVSVTDKAVGVMTDENGIFELTVPNNATELTVICLGYSEAKVPIKKKQVNLYDIRLKPITNQLQEVVVRRQKYSKKNNPAVEFVQRLKSSAELTDPMRNPYYNYNKHEVITMGLNNFAQDGNDSWMLKKFPFLIEHIDTSEISGKPILKFLIKEKASEVHYRKSPNTTKEIVTGMRQEGIDEEIDPENFQTLLEDVLREINLYDNDLYLLQNKFVSPLSRIAPDFYKFYLTDTVTIDNEPCIVLSFYPHNTASFGFNGQIYVPANDSTMFIKRVTMRAPKNINLNFIENLYITQDYTKAPDGSRLKTNDDVIIEANILKNKKSGFYVRRHTAYDKHSFEQPADSTIFDIMQRQIVESDATQRSDDFWEENRILFVTINERRIAELMTQLRSVPVFYWTERIIKTMFAGYVQTGKDSKFDIGPLNTFISSSPVDGWRLRVGGMTTANLSPRLFSRGYVAYGTKDHKWKYGAELEYSFIDKTYHPREFPIQSIKLTSTYDINQLGQQYLFTNQDNIFLSLKRMTDYQVTYQQVNSLVYTLELHNNFSLTATLKNDRQYASDYIKFVDGYGRNYNNYLENSLTVQLRYAPGEKYFQARSMRIPINLDAPIFVLTHTIAPKGWLGSNFMVNKTELSFQKRIWFSAFGFTDVILKGGHVWSRSPFINLLIPNANLSYTIQPESYALLNPMEFINDSYGSCDITYWLNGALLNNIPLIKKLKLREAVNFKALWGNLSDKNDPANDPELFRFPTISQVNKMNHTPYMEISAGLDNLFKCLRVDYVWRLSYLDVPYQIDRRGLRIAMHVTF